MNGPVRLEIDFGKAWDEFAKALGKTRDELTYTQKQQAIFGATIEALEKGRDDGNSKGAGVLKEGE